MLPLAADENLNNDIIRGVLRHNPKIDIVRVQDVGLRGADDPTVLEWAAAEGRVLLTHDVATMSRYAYSGSLPAAALTGPGLRLGIPNAGGMTVGACP
ncbi:MAG: DUF5615 family PIN-like protein [Pseudonocardiaceae bacterium]